MHRVDIQETRFFDPADLNAAAAAQHPVLGPPNGFEVEALDIAGGSVSLTVGPAGVKRLFRGEVDLKTLVIVFTAPAA